ncbi:MAG TPA: VWA domain-containing protein [Thermoanaerobaculia bacterium]|jgi:VWFA-related protein|nr:VWA domain-containing protein [Thermoanaerobaculia bacterium]
MGTWVKKLLAATVLAVPVFAQTHSESITVEVVDVPVYVYNAHGALQNLKKDDFELYVNGKPQAIDYFDAIDFRAPAKSETAPAPTAPPRDIRDRRLFLLMIDCAFTRPAAIERARNAAAAMIDASLPTDYFSVGTFTSKNGAQLIVPFTNDHLVAKRAALTLKASSVRDPLAITISNTERENAMTMAILNDDRGGDPNDAAARGMIGGAAGDNSAMPLIRLMQDQLTDFTEIANRLASFQGYKHVIVLSQGFSPGATYRENGLMEQIKSMARAFRRAGAVVDAVDVSGISGNFRDDASYRDPLANDVLHVFAGETGGQFVEHANDVGAALNRISSDSAVGYRLGFHMPKDAKKGDNTIDVKVRNVPSGTTLSFRRGFSTVINKPSTRDDLLLADIIINDVPQTGLAPAIRFVEKPNVEVWIPAQKLLALNNGAAVNADILFYIFDAKGAVVDFKGKKLVIPSDAKQDIALRDVVRLPPGSYVAKALLRAGDSLGFVKQEFVLR